MQHLYWITDPLKQNLFSIRITVAGDRLQYAEDVGSPTTNILEAKRPLNSVTSDASKGARFLCADLIDHFVANA